MQQTYHSEDCVPRGVPEQTSPKIPGVIGASVTHSCLPDQVWSSEPHVHLQNRSIENVNNGRLGDPT